MKEELRQKFSKLRKKLPLMAKTTLDRDIFGHLSKFQPFQKSKEILLYYPVNNEVDIFKNLLHDKEKNFYLPVINKNKIIVRKIETEKSLIKGQYGIMIPDKSCKELKAELLEMILIPGLIFSKNKQRIGYGKGYYDRFLKNLSAKKIGLAYDFQIIEDFLTEKHDQAMDYIITEKGVF